MGTTVRHGPHNWEHFSFYASGGVDGAFIESLAPGKIFKITEVRLHLSVVHASIEDFVMRLSGINGTAFSQVFISQAMLAVNNYHWLPENDLIFFSDDQIVFSLFVKSATNIYGLDVKGWAVLG